MGWEIWSQDQRRGPKGQLGHSTTTPQTVPAGRPLRLTAVSTHQCDPGGQWRLSQRPASSWGTPPAPHWSCPHSASRGGSRCRPARSPCAGPVSAGRSLRVARGGGLTAGPSPRALPASGAPQLPSPNLVKISLRVLPPLQFSGRVWGLALILL